MIIVPTPVPEPALRRLSSDAPAPRELPTEGLEVGDVWAFGALGFRAVYGLGFRDWGLVGSFRVEGCLMSRPRLVVEYGLGLAVGFSGLGFSAFVVSWLKEHFYEG